MQKENHINTKTYNYTTIIYGALGGEEKQLNEFSSPLKQRRTQVSMDPASYTALFVSLLAVWPHCQESVCPGAASPAETGLCQPALEKLA